MRKLAIAAALGAAGYFGAPAQAQTVMLNFSFPEMQQQLIDQKVTITKEGDAGGIHYIQGKAESGLVFAIYGMECEGKDADQRCKGADMISSFTLADPTKIYEALDMIDQAALADYKGDDGNFKLSRYVIFDNGITPANLKVNIEVFLSLSNQVWDKLDDAKLLK